MIDFVYGTDQQYEKLKEGLEDHLCHAFLDCYYPSCCVVGRGRLGFEKEGDTYVLYIDRGNECTDQNAPDLFKTWIETGTLRFLDFNDLKEFLLSLKCLY